MKYTVIRNAFYCLETVSEKNISDIYTQALVTYAFCLAGKAEICESFLRELQKSAKEVGEFQPFQDLGRWEDGIHFIDGMHLDNIESIGMWIRNQTFPSNYRESLQHICCSTSSSCEKGQVTVCLRDSIEQWYQYSFSLLFTLFVYSDGSKYWEQKQRSPPEKSHLLDHVPSNEVEITSYVLLALLYKPNHNQEDLTKASAIVQWIVRQQNPYGGFSSTQVHKLPFPSWS